MQKNSFELSLLINNKPIVEYTDKESNTWVEGRKKSNYTIRIKNNTYSRVLAIVSVDGMNVLNGKLASSKDNGYILSSRETLDIPGWTLDSDQVAKFEFSESDNSYSVQMGKGENNLGVIGVKIFYEKIQRTPIQHVYLPWPWTGERRKTKRYNDWVQPYYNINNSVPYNGDINFYSSQNMVLGISDSMSYSSTEPSVNSILRSSASMSSGKDCEIQEQEITLGTGFGKATEFKTTTTNFERGAEAITLIIRYGTKKQMEKVGIVFEKKVKNKPVIKPQAFPGDFGCPTPPGYTR